MAIVEPEQPGASAFSCWEDLPQAVVLRISSFVPYRRGTLRATCAAWRAAIDSAVNSVELPEEDAPLLTRLRNLRRITMRFRIMPPMVPEGRFMPLRYDELVNCMVQATLLPEPTCSYNDTWACMSNATLSNLRELRLGFVPVTLTQLAARLCGSSASDGPGAVLHQLQVLDLLDCGGAVLPALAMQPPAGGLAQLQSLQLHIVLAEEGDMDARLGLLRDLPSLRELSLQRLMAPQLPDAVMDCTLLTRLDLSYSCWLLELPQQISRLSGLQELSLEDCGSLRSLTAISSLTQLSSLNLSGTHRMWLKHDMSHSNYERHLTPLMPLPGSGSGSGSSLREWADMTSASLRLIDEMFSNDPDVALWKDPAVQQRMLRELEPLGCSLRSLALARLPAMQVLPDALSALSALTKLDASKSGLRWLEEDSVLCCGALLELSLADTLIDELPPSISRLTQLELLNIECCDCLWGLPTELIDMTTLRYLHITRRSIEQNIIEKLEARTPPVDVVERCGSLDSVSEESWIGEDPLYSEYSDYY